MSCPYNPVSEQDPRFQKLLEKYKSRHLGAEYIAEALQLYREYRLSRTGQQLDIDWIPETPSERGAFTRFMNDKLPQVKLSKTTSDLEKDDLYNLYSTLYSLYEAPETLADRIELLDFHFRKEVDELQKNDNGTHTRQQLIELQGDGKKNGYAVIMERVFSKLKNSMGNVETAMKTFDEKFPNAPAEKRARALEGVEYRAKEIQKMLDNKERLAALAAARIADNEGFYVNVRGMQVELSDVDDAQENADPVAESENGKEQKQTDNEEATKGDRYSDFRLTKLMQTLAPQLRRLLCSIHRLDAKGNPIRSDIGNYKFVGPRQGAVILQKVLTNSTPESMLDDIKAAAGQYPWLKELAQRVEKDTQLQALLWSLKSVEHTYVYITDDGGNLRLKIANTKSRGRGIEEEAINNLMKGHTYEDETSIVTGYGWLVSKDKLESIRKRFRQSYLKVQLLKRVSMLTDSEPSQYAQKNTLAMIGSDEKDAEAIERIRKTATSPEEAEQKIEEYRQERTIFRDARAKQFAESLAPGESHAFAMDRWLDLYKEVPDELAALLRGMGYDISREDIIAMAKQEMTSKSALFVTPARNSSGESTALNKMVALVDAMNAVYARASEIWDNSAGAATASYLYNTNEEGFPYITNCLALTKFNELQPRVLNEGKVLNTNTPISLLHQVVDDLCNKDGRTNRQYRTDLEKNYLRYEGMALGRGKDKKVSGWLERFRRDETGLGFRSLFRVVDNVGSNHVEYSELSKVQHLQTSFVSFLNYGGYEGWCYIEIPIQSDYSTAYNFVHCPRMKRSEIVDNLVDEVLMEVERIAAINRRTQETIIDAEGKRVPNPNYDPNRVKLDGVYEKNGKRFQIFPSMNRKEFVDRLVQARRKNPESVRALVAAEVEAQLNTVIARDYNTVKATKLLTNPLLHGFYQKDGDPQQLDESRQDTLESWFLNTFYARQQMSKLLTGGMEQFNGLIDYEKRNMMVHAPHTSLYTKATWKGKLVGREEQTALYMDDEKQQSKFIAEISELLDDLRKEGLITDRQYETMKDAYTNITVTDGQGFRFMDSYREVMIMAALWDDRHEAAYDRLLAGHPTTGDIDLFLAEIKPVFSGYEHIPAAAGEDQKPVRLNVLHKYSETVLLPVALAQYCMKGKVVPLQAMAKARERLSEEGKRIDLFAFKSCVKVGYHSQIRPFVKWGDLKDDEERKAHGWNGEPLEQRIRPDEQSLEDYIVTEVTKRPDRIHKLPYKYYGIAASMPVKVEDERNHWVSQAEKQVWGNITSEDNITVRGKDMSATEARDKYYEMKTADIILAYQEMRRIFDDSDELERLLDSELATKPYNSGELKFALAHLKDGDFAVPLYSPNVEHQVMQLFSSIIKKRLVKQPVKGANLLQSTGLGMDMDVSSFDNRNALSEDEKLGIKWGRKDGKLYIKHVDVAMPIHDKRLKRYADKNGIIDAKTLKSLVDQGIIDEKILQFVAYRTPSDGEHSVIPCRVKYFTTGVDGMTIRMPKEIMVMTGHDYDGDKMHCHFAEFEEAWNEEALHNAYEAYLKRRDVKDILDSETDILRYIMGLSTDGAELLQDKGKVLSEEMFNRRIKKAEREKGLDTSRFRKMKYIEYDYGKSALKNSKQQRLNGRLELMFSKIASVRGSRMMVIPGGCEQTKVIAKALHLTRLAANSSEVRGLLAKTFNVNAGNTVQLYNTLVEQSDDTLTKLIRQVSGNETPYSLTHASEAFEYIMGGAEMIDVYALYSSAYQMFQRLNLSYRPRVSKNGNTYNVVLFGHPIGRLCGIRTHAKADGSKGALRSTTSSHLLNAAVDNGKDPILGYLNQTPQLASLTAFLDAAGLEEEEIHLLINQPALVELANRLKQRDSKSITEEAGRLIKELTEGFTNETMDIVKMAATEGTESFLAQWVGLDVIGKKERDDYIRNIATSYEELKDTRDSGNFEMAEMQVALLQTIIHLNPAVNKLSRFVKRTRPESDAGGLGMDVADLIIKLEDLESMNERIEGDETTALQQDIEGMEGIIDERDVHEGYDPEYIMEATRSPLQEVTALTSLMLYETMPLMAQRFPQARKSWSDFAMKVAKRYRFRDVKSGLLKKIQREMLLYKMLQNKKFAPGNLYDEYKRVRNDVPKWFSRLSEKIEKGAIDDEEQKRLLTANAFLRHLSFESPENSKGNARLKFNSGNMEAENAGELIRASWNQLLKSDVLLSEEGEPEYRVKDLAVDLYLYNVYTNGLNYGAYEFWHLAPFSVVAKTPFYLEAMHEVLKTDWTDDAEQERFLDQYLLNHWGDQKLLYTYSIKSMKISSEAPSGEIWLTKENNPRTISRLAGQRFVVVSNGEKKSGKNSRYRESVYRVMPGNNEGTVLILKKAPKLGSKNFYGQSSLYYNPSLNWDVMEPVQAGNDSAWGQLDVLDPYAESNINAPGMNRQPQQSFNIDWGAQISAFLAGGKRGSMARLEKSAETAVQENEGKDLTAQQSTDPTVETTEAVETPNEEQALPFDPQSIISGFLAGRKMPSLSVARIDETGKAVVENVPATPYNVERARKQKVYVKLNKRLRELMRRAGFSAGVINEFEERLNLAGVTDFDTATVTAEGLIEGIRLANGVKGEQALPEEFAHLFIELLGHDHPLVKRLLDSLRTNDRALEEAYNGQYQQYAEIYGNDRDLLLLEAAGKLVAKQLFREQEIETKPIRNLIHRVCEAIKSVLRRLFFDDFRNAVLDANDAASTLARGLLGGRLLDDADLDNIRSTAVAKMYAVTKPLQEREDILARLLKIAMQRRDLLNKRLAYVKKGTKANAMSEIQATITMLQRNIDSMKQESVVVNYLERTTRFLDKTRQSLEAAIGLDTVGREKANSVGKKLMVMRDAISEASQALEAIEAAIEAKELEDSAELKQARDAMTTYLRDLTRETNTIGLSDLENMLADTYGSEGVTQNIGKNKGRRFTPHEMATKAPSDVSFMTRWFSALSDSGDFVLLAIDDYVKNAKRNARQRLETVRTTTYAAIAELERETGSRDQSFMFEKKRYDGGKWCNGLQDDGKLHSTGRYIRRHSQAYKNLSAAQKKYYETMIRLKDEIDKCVPEPMLIDGRIIMIRKDTLDRVKAAEGVGAKAGELWEAVKNRFLDNSEDLDYENDIVAVDFDGNPVDKLPLKYLYKGKKELYDDMTDDVATSMIAYACMALEYNEMNKVIGIIENAKYMAAQRDVAQRSGWRSKIQAVKDEEGNTAFTKPITVKQAKTLLNGMVNDYMQMQVYGHIQKDEGTFGKTRISKRKVANELIGATSISQMAINFIQRISNLTTGQVQILIDAVGHGDFNLNDVLWATLEYMKQTPDRLVDTGADESDNYLSLFLEHFDIHQNNRRDGKKLKKGRLARMFNTSLLYTGLAAGEDALAGITTLAMAHAHKVKNTKDNKDYTLYDAYERKYVDPEHKKGAYLTLKEGFVEPDLGAITKQVEAAFEKRTVRTNFDNQGIYNLDDRSAIMQYALGSLIIMYRKWIYPAMKRRYADVKYDKMRDQFTEGFHRTMGRFVLDILKDTKDSVTEEKSVLAMLNLYADVKALITAVKMNWEILDPYEKENIRKSLTELGTVFGLWLSIALLRRFHEDDDDGELSWWDNSVMVQLLRLRTEIGSMAPTPMLVNEAGKIVRTPFAAMGTIQDALNGFRLLIPSNYWTEIQAGRYKGHTKAYKYFRELPLVSVLKKVENFIDPSPLINYYANDSTY